MASPIATSGFQVQAVPRTDYLDPRLFAPNYSALVPAVNQGAELVQETRMRPIREQMAQLQIQEAQQRLAMMPLNQQLLEAHIAEAGQNAATPRIVPGDVQLIDQTRIFPAALDENGERTGPEEKVFGDLVEVQNIREVGPGGVITPRTVRKTLKTAAEQELANRRVDDLDNYRTGLVENQRLKALVAQTKLDNPNFQKLGYGVNEAGHIVYTLRNTKTGEIEQVDSGQKPAMSGEEARIRAIIGGTGAPTGALNVPTAAAQPAALPQEITDAITAVTTTAPNGNTDTFVVGKVYTDDNGNTATYLGNGQWR